MPFRLRKDARSWFKHVDKQFTLDFDMYYICLIAGLTANRKEQDIGNDETTELVENFPGEFKSYGKLIISLFLSIELESMGVDFSDRKIVHSAIRDYIDPASLSGLSDNGMREMNRYSYGGFEVLTEEFDDAPRALEIFLPMFQKMIIESTE